MARRSSASESAVSFSLAFPNACLTICAASHDCEKSWSGHLNLYFLLVISTNCFAIGRSSLQLNACVNVVPTAASPASFGYVTLPADDAATRHTRRGMPTSNDC